MIERVPRVPEGRPTLIAIRYQLIFDDLMDLFEKYGFEVEIWEPGDVTVARFEARVAQSLPWGLFAINYSPELAFLTSHFDVPYITWTIDPLPLHRLRLRPGTRPEFSLSFVHRSATRLQLEQLGLTDVRTLPLAAPTERRERVTQPDALRDYRAPISFVGNSLNADANSLGVALRRLNVGVDEMVSIRAQLQSIFEQRGDERSYQGESSIAEAIVCTAWEREPDGLEGLRLLDAINGFISERLRFARVEALAPMGIEVWGDLGWRRTSATFRGLAEHGDELTRIYCASQINLDIPRIYQRDILTMRVFDALSCGGVLLTEESAVLSEHFVSGEHLFTYSDTSDMVVQAQKILDNPELAQEVARAGEAHVRAHHRMEGRFATILEACAERGWLVR